MKHRYGGSVYAVASGKGGVGKTTATVNLGVVLGQAGLDVVVVDADLAMTNLGQRLGIDHQPGIHQVLAGDAPVRDAVVRGPGGLAAVTGDRELESFAAADPAELDRVLELLSVAFEVVLVDTGPGIQRDASVTYRAADGVVLVTTPTAVAVEDANRTASMAADADCPAVGAIVTRADGTEPEEIGGLDPEPLAVVPEHETGGPVTASQPASDAAGAYRTAAAALPDVDTARVIPPDQEPATDGDHGTEATGKADERSSETSSDDENDRAGDQRTPVGESADDTTTESTATDDRDAESEEIERGTGDADDTATTADDSDGDEATEARTAAVSAAYRTLTGALSNISADSVLRASGRSPDDAVDRDTDADEANDATPAGAEDTTAIEVDESADTDGAETDTATSEGDSDETDAPAADESKSADTESDGTVSEATAEGEMADSESAAAGTAADRGSEAETDEESVTEETREDTATP